MPPRVHRVMRMPFGPTLLGAAELWSFAVVVGVPMQVELLPPHTPQTSKVKLELTTPSHPISQVRLAPKHTPHASRGQPGHTGEVVLSTEGPVGGPHR